MGGKVCVVMEGVDVVPVGSVSWFWAGVYDQCPVVGAVDWYDGVNVCVMCCVYVLEGPGRACWCGSCA